MACGDWAVYADGQGSLHSVNLVGPTRTGRFDELAVGGVVRDLKAAGSYVLATVSGVGLVIVSVDTGNLAQVGVLPFSGYHDQLGVDSFRAVVHLQYMVVAYVDWSDPSAPVELGRALLSDFWPSAVAVRGTDVFVSGTDPDYMPALWRVGFSDPENPQILNQSVVMPDPFDGEAQIMDILPTEEQVYLAYQRVIRYGPMELEPRMVLITTPPDGVFTPGVSPVIDVGQGDVANLQLSYDEILLYGSGLAVFALDAADPATPLPLGRYVDDRPFPPVYTNLQAHAGNLYATGEGSLGVFDVSDPTAPALAIEYSFYSDGPCLFLGDNLYLVSYPYDLDVYGAADPMQITPLAHTILDGVLGIAGYVDILIVSRNAANPVLEFYQVTDPLAPALIGSVSAEAYHYKLWVEGGLLFGQPYDGSVEVFSIADPTTPVSLSSIPIIGMVRNLRLEEEILYLAVEGEGMQVVDLGIPGQPRRLGGVPSNGYPISLTWFGGQPLYSEGSTLMGAAPFCWTSDTGVENSGVPAGLLVQAHPNPFNPRVNLRVDLPISGPARVDIVDVRGRRVRELFSGFRAAGPFDLQWDGRNDRGRALPSGVYFVQLKGEDAISTAKITLLR